MPVRFRCDTCNGKLSIATRKIGLPVECPRCKQSMLVPTASQIGEELTELLMTVGSPRREATEETHAHEEQTAPKPAAPLPPAPKPQKQRPRKSLEELPLFERDDLDEILETHVNESKPLPLPDPRPVQPVFDPHAHIDAIVISRTKATVLAVIVVILLGFAFVLGYVLRGYAVPSGSAEKRVSFSPSYEPFC